MSNTFSSMFSVDNCNFPYFLITGMTNDNFVTEEQILTNIKLLLYRHLKEQGFDAVIFYDTSHGLHFYDRESIYIFDNRVKPTDEDLDRSSSTNVRTTGKNVSDFWNTSVHMFRPHKGQNANRTNERTVSYHRKDLYRNQVYELLRNVLSASGYRCAVVFNDLHSVLLQSGDGVVESRDRMLRAVYENRAENNNILVFIANSNSNTCLKDILAPRFVGQDWSNFIDDVLLSFSQDENNEHVLRITSPGSTEIRNMINMLRLRNGLRVKLQEIDAISRNLAAFCSNQEKSLSWLYGTIMHWQSRHPDQEFDLSAAASITGTERFKSAKERMAEFIGMDELKTFFARKMLTYGSGNDTSDDNPNRLLIRHFSGSIRGHGLNLALMGNPGTGKTSVARLIGDCYREIGLLPNGKLLEISATQLVNPNYVHEYTRRAIGGVLFIDEAYSIMENFQSGQLVIDALVADMGTYAGQMAFVFAGYEEPTIRFLEANSGLEGRIPKPNRITLPDYTGDQLLSIFMSMAEKKDQLDLSELRKPENTAVLRNMFNGWVRDNSGPNWENARAAESLLPQLEERCADRTARNNTASDRLVPELRDFPEELQNFSSGAEENIQEAITRLNKITGMGNVKKAIIKIARSKQLNKGSIKEPGNYIFMGPPGTGKSMMADRIGEIFQLLGLVKRRTPYKITAKQLLRPPKPSRPGAVVDLRENSLNDALQRSENGILFIDEAHQLAESEENSAGRSLLTQLVSIMEDESFRRKHCIILAGYTTQMQKLLDTDPGLESRFPKSNRIKFLNYTYQELSEIMQKMAKENGDILDPEFIKRTELALSKYLFTPRINFGNARFIRNEYLPAARAARDERIISEKFGKEAAATVLTKEQNAVLEENPTDLVTITKYDIPDKPVNFKMLVGPADAEIGEPKDTQELVNMLSGKNEVKSFIHAINRAGNTETGYNSGKNYIVGGPVGCGKDTVITAIANTFASHGLIDSREIFHLSKGDLEAGYVGQTAIKTRTAVTSAQGGTAVLVQPSSLLARDSSDRSFGPEAIDEFLRCMGEFGENTSFVIVDSEDGIEKFLKAYPSVSSLFEHHFKLDDLSIESMQEIFRYKTEEELIFDEEIRDVLDDFIANWTADRGGLGDRFLSWANGDEIEKLVKKLEDNWESQNGEIRIDKKRNYPCKYIVKEMFPKTLHKYFRKTTEENEEVLTAMYQEIGLVRVKEAIKAIEASTRRMPGDNRAPGNYCFIGNPGVGKTRMAQKLGNVLRATGALKQGHVIVKTAREMMQQYNDFDKFVRMARDNILFIDEAHQLAESSYGNEVIKRLLTVLEDVDVTKNTCFILAGYPREMMHMLQMDAGLASRFGTSDSILVFDDYTVDELIEIMCKMAEKASEEPRFRTNHNYDLSSEANRPFMSEVRKGLENTLSKKDPNYGNARYVRNLLQDTISAQILRLDKEHPNNEPIPEEEFAVFSPEDLRSNYRAEETSVVSSKKAVKADQILTGPANPILPENYSRSIEDISQSILLLELLDKNGNIIGHGTGFIITEDGYVLTCEHVVRDAYSIRARLYYRGMIGGERWFEDCDILLPAYKDIDMGMIKINKVTDMKPLKLRAENSHTDMAESIVICGYPFGKQLQINNDPKFVPSVFNGTISSVQQEGTEMERVFINCEAKSGNSGSPVISKTDGCVIGMLDGSTSSKSGDLVEEINYFTPIRMAWERFIE